MSEFGFTTIMGVEFPQVIPYTIIKTAYGTDGKLYELEYSLVDMREWSHYVKEEDYEQLCEDKSDRETK